MNAPPPLSLFHRAQVTIAAGHSQGLRITCGRIPAFGSCAA